MIDASVRAGLAAIVGLALWWSWRRARPGVDVAVIVGIALAVRGILGAALFWVSYLELPIARSLQLGNGFWFIAWDGLDYFRYADAAVAEGLPGILGLDTSLPSPMYIRTLAFVMYIVGRVPSAALLMNLLAFLGLCAAIVQLSRRARASRLATAFALSAVGFSPSWILWSVQPLKDSFFMCLVGAYTLGLLLWLEHRAPGGRRLSASAAALTYAGLWGALYAMSGIRWYFATLILGATWLGWLVAVLPGGWRGYRRAAAGVVLAAALSQAVPIGAGSYLPGWIRPLFRPGTESLQRLRDAPARALKMMDTFRDRSAAEGDTGIHLRTNAEPRPEPAPVSVPRQADAPALPPAASAKPAAFDASGGAIVPAPRARAPETVAEKVFVGAVAMVVPRWLGSTLGWIDVGGGRGLWVFAEIDTLCFDLVLAGAIVGITVRLRQRAVPHPAFWPLFLVTVAMTGLLAYDGGNFGTLFRHRGMVYIGLVLLPLLFGPSTNADDDGAREALP
jgi:hypothetical protein